MKKIAVIGAGTMGNGIAHVLSMYGYDVSLVDISESALERGMVTIRKNMERMLATTNMKVTGASISRLR